MKQFLFITAFCCTAGIASAQQVYDANHVLKGYITKAGIVQNKSGQTLCSFMQDGRIVDPKANTLGYVVDEHELQDKNHKTVGYILRDGSLQDAQHNPMGRIDRGANGPIIDAKNNIIGYIETIEPTRAAAYFFILKY